jgi:hypothetical protein
VAKLEHFPGVTRFMGVEMDIFVFTIMAVTA